MRLLINIPKEFEQHFQADKFEDSLHRLSADAHLLAGNYEQETAVMLIESFKSAIHVLPHGRLIDADELIEKQKEDAEIFIGSTNYCDKVRYDEAMNAVANIVNAPTVIPADKDGET